MKGNSFLLSRALEQLLWFSKRNDIRFGGGIGWFERMQLVRDLEISPGTHCKAQVGMRMNTQAPLQRLNDPLGGPGAILTSAGSGQARDEGMGFNTYGTRWDGVLVLVVISPASVNETFQRGRKEEDLFCCWSNLFDLRVYVE